VLIRGANVGQFLQFCKFSGDFSSQSWFFHPVASGFFVSLRLLYINRCIMVTELIIVWVLGVVSFFVLWAVLLKVIQRVSKRKRKKEE